MKHGKLTPAFILLASITLATQSACSDSAKQSAEGTKTQDSTEQLNKKGERVVVATATTPPVNDGIPMPGLTITKEDTALVLTDPQNDFLSPKGSAWGAVGQSVTENGTVKNIGELLKVADKVGMPTFISPHYYYPYDHRWHFEGTFERVMHTLPMFEREGPLSLKDFEGSGADWLKQYKPYIQNGKTVVTSPHKLYGPEHNDLLLQLRKRGINKVVLGGMSANLCTESHMRELIERGFEVMVVTDATAGAITEHYNTYDAALVNFRMIANRIDNTENTVAEIRSAFK